MTTRKTIEGSNKDDVALMRAAALRGDAAFKHAMLKAQKDKTEIIVIGVLKRPCTDNPRVTPSRGLPQSGGGSPAAMCAEVGGSHSNSRDFR